MALVPWPFFRWRGASHWRRWRRLGGVDQADMQRYQMRFWRKLHLVGVAKNEAQEENDVHQQCADQSEYAQAAFTRLLAHASTSRDNAN